MKFLRYLVMLSLVAGGLGITQTAGPAAAAEPCGTTNVAVHRPATYDVPDQASWSSGGGTQGWVINNTGGRADATTQQRYVVSYP